MALPRARGDLCVRAIESLAPGIIVHGVALKPGKPICLAAHGQKPVVILPGFPTSAIFTFHEFVAPVIRRLAGNTSVNQNKRTVEIATDIRSEKGRLEYLLVGLVPKDNGQLAAYPMGKGSGSVTAFSRADGFIRIPRNTELVNQKTQTEVTLLGNDLELADLVIIGSHCIGLDRIASLLASEGFRIKSFALGSQAGIEAAKRGECDLAPIHLFDQNSGQYNTPFLDNTLELIPGYRRMQGVVTRKEETRAFDTILQDESLRMVNRNRGSGTRILIEEVLTGHKPAGFSYQPRSHYAVAQAVLQGRADWGIAIESVARESGLNFIPLREEHYDFALPSARKTRPAVGRFIQLLTQDSNLREHLNTLGFKFREATADE